MDNIFAVIVSWLIGIFAGWLLAHGTVRDKCLRLGGFYVGNKTFVCQLKEK